SLPDGGKRYENDLYARTTTHLTAEQIHELGLHEIERIEAEMTAIAKKEGSSDLASFRAALKENRKYAATSSEQILDDFRRYIAQMEPKLPQLFGALPKSPVTVEAIPAFQAATATHYVAGTPDGKRPGRVVVATSNFAERSLVDDEAVAYHEGIPGHHMQISIQRQLTGLPTFRLQGLGFGAFTEGWALYAEQLGKEVGFYQDPVSDYGRLSSELFRAVRLVVDTGIHSKGWSREQVVEFMRKSGAVDEPTIQSETDRYIAWPAPGAGVQRGAGEDGGATRASAEGAREPVRHQELQRRDAERRRASAGPARCAHERLDPGAETTRQGRREIASGLLSHGPRSES